MAERALRTERFLILVRQLAETHGSEAAVERYLKLSTGQIAKLRSEPWRNVGAKVLERVRDRLRLRAEYFTDPRLGSAPDYRRFIGEAEAIEHEDRTVWVELEQDGYIDFARRKGVGEQEIQHIRRHPDGRGGLTKDDLRRMLDEAIARAQRAEWKEHELEESRKARARRRREGKPIDPLPDPDRQ